MTPLESTLTRLEDQLNWYDQKSCANQRYQKISNFIQICVAAGIPIASLMKYSILAAFSGAVIAILKGLEASCQWEYNWINYRATAEKLKHEKFLYEAEAGPYAEKELTQRLLAERVEAIVSREHASWITLRDERGNCNTTNAE